MNNDNGQNHTAVSGAKGSEASVQVSNGGVEGMLAQLQQILGQITQSMNSDASTKVGDSENGQKLMEQARELAVSLQEQGNEGEAALHAVLPIIDTLADMLDNGQISLSK